ncbi:hypothetical protein PSFL107428_19480 [Pseudoalteromonas maricaloris]
MPLLLLIGRSVVPILINLGQVPINYKLNMGRKRARESNIV